MPLVSFSPSTVIKSADVNTNFTGLANGSLMTSPSIANCNLTTAFTASGLYNNGSQNGTYNIDWSKGDRQQVTLNGNITFTYSNAIAGQILTLEIIENSTGGFTITLPTSKWPGGSAGVFTTTANAKNTLTVMYDGTDYLTQLGAGYA